MGRRSRWPRPDLASHPIFDQFFPIAAFTAVLWWGAAIAPSSEATRVPLYVGASTVAAVAVAAATFVCTLTYQSDSEYMKIVRIKYFMVLRKNWTSILMSTLAAAVLPLVAILIDAYSVPLAMAIVAYSLALVLARFYRSVFWLRLILGMTHASDARPDPMVVNLPVRKVG